MNEDKWLAEFDGSSCGEDELAHTAVGCTSDLGIIAKDFLEARSAFLAYLDSLGFEWG